MAMIAMLSAKAAPGVTTGVAVLASVWPGPVIAVDADPAGGDLARGWLGQSIASGKLRNDVGVSSFAARTRQLGTGTPNMVVDHLQPMPNVRDGRLLVGLSGPAPIEPVEMSDWCRLAESLSGLCRRRPGDVDVLVDCGRFGPNTPWPLLTMADLVLLVVRPQRRFLYAAAEVVTMLGTLVEQHKLGLAVFGMAAGQDAHVRQVLGLTVGLRLPEDSRTALVYSDGADRPSRLHRTALVRGAHLEATRLCRALKPDLSGQGFVPDAVPADLTTIRGHLPLSAARRNT